jgi:type IV pilus assembly protein PilW
MNYRVRRQAGLTLVELMIATTLSLVLLAGVLLVFSANKTTYRMQNGLGTLQENGRYALRQITADLQMAGFGGCLSPNVGPRIVVVAKNPPTYLEDFAGGEFFTGVNGAATSYGGQTSVAGTDAIEIRGPLRSSVSFVTGETPASGDVDVVGDGTGFAVGDYMMISDCAGGEIFRATGVSINTDGDTEIGHSSTNNQQSVLSRPYTADAVVTELTTHTYFVADTGRNTAAGQDILALYRFDGTGAAQELVDGVENLQIEYGLDSVSSDGVIDEYTDSPSSVADWSNVKAVRVMLLLNSVDAASTVPPDYTYFGLQTTAFNQSASTDLRLRQEFSAVVSVRNSVL